MHDQKLPGQWQSEGVEPLSVRQETERLGNLDALRSSISRQSIQGRTVMKNDLAVPPTMARSKLPTGFMSNLRDGRLQVVYRALCASVSLKIVHKFCLSFKTCPNDRANWSSKYRRQYNGCTTAVHLNACSLKQRDSASVKTFLVCSSHDPILSLA